MTGPRATGSDATGGGAARRWLAEAATERLGFKAAAIFLAVALWLAVTAEESAEQLVPVRLALVVDSTLAVAGPRTEVRALVAGRRRELLKLFETAPVVRHAITGDEADTVRLPLRPADVDLPPGVEAVVRDVQPRAILVRLVRLHPGLVGRDTAAGGAGDSSGSAREPSDSLRGPRPLEGAGDRAASLEGPARDTATSDSARRDSARRAARPAGAPLPAPASRP